MKTQKNHPNIPLHRLPDEGVGWEYTQYVMLRQILENQFLMGRNVHSETVKAMRDTIDLLLEFNEVEEYQRLGGAVYSGRT